jgi:trimethylamine--corrinoid protein Co-methyltransferase
VRVLDEGALDAIVEGALNTLEDVGFVYSFAPALKTVAAAGARVDHGTQKARLPRALVEEALRLTPASVHLPGRTAEHDLTIGPPEGAGVAFTVSGGGSIADRHTDRQRPLLRADVGEVVTFIDHVPQVDFLNSPLAVADCRRELAGETILAEVLKYARKPIGGCGPIGVDVDKRVQLELADAAGRVVMNAIGPVSPLSLAPNMCEALMLWAERGWPSLCWSGPSPGANGPATIAGTLTLAVAEIMAQIVLAQTTGPGMPIVAGYSAMLMDMRSGAVYTGIEGVLLCNAAAQVLHRFGIPFWSACPMVTGNVAGWQNGMQVGMQAPLLALGGGDIVSFSGGRSMDCAYAYDQILLDAELIATTRRLLRGVQVDEETQALDLIRQVGPAPGDYLRSQHTRERHRAEIFVPELFSTTTYASWQASGEQDMVTRARTRAEELWATEVEAEPLPDEVCRALDDILATAEARL